MKFSASVLGAVCGLMLMGGAGAHAMPLGPLPAQGIGAQVTDVQFYDDGPGYGYGGYAYGGP